MKIDRININNISLISLLEFSYKKKTNQHCEAVIYGLIAESNCEQYFRKSYTEEWASIMGFDELGNTICIFSGYIKDMSIIQEKGHKAIKLVLVSGTYLMDLIRHTLTYQDETEQYAVIINMLSLKYPKNLFHISQEAMQPLNKMLVQYEETDWEFIKRMASELNLLVIPHASHEGVSFDFGVDEWKNSVYISNTIENTEKYYKGYLTYIVKTREYIDIGTRVNYKDSDYYVYEANGEYINQELINTYELRRLEDFEQKVYFNNRIIGASLEANVLNIQKDQVQVQVIGENGRKRKWFPYATIYSSPDGTGWYCMPERGDRVRLYFPSNIENDAYVISSIHLPVSQNSESSNEELPRSNCDNKSIRNKDGKEILFTPNSIVLTNNKGMTIEINDKEGISIISNKNVVIESTGDVEFTSVNGGLSIIANEEIDLVQNTSGINIKNDITISGGRIRTV